LKTHLLSLYAANKTGRPVTKNACSAMIVEPGGKSFKELIAQTKRGLLVGGFSGEFLILKKI
jgi:PmbA protein